MFILIPALWPAIPVFLAMAAFFATGPATYSAAAGGFGGTMVGIVSAAACLMIAF